VSASETPAPVAANLPLRSWFKGPGIDEFELDHKLSSLLCATSGREDVVVGFGISMDDDLELDSGSPTLRGGLLYSRVLRNLGPMRGSCFRRREESGMFVYLIRSLRSQTPISSRLGRSPESILRFC
jgi:hypothetical protein